MFTWAANPFLKRLCQHLDLGPNLQSLGKALPGKGESEESRQNVVVDFVKKQNKQHVVYYSWRGYGIRKRATRITLHAANLF